MSKRNAGHHRMAAYLPLAAVALVGAATPAVPQAPQGGELVALCQRGEAAVPQSCGCTVDRARQAGVSEVDLRSLLTDDGKRRPVAQSTYSRFWQLKIQCISEATMAGLPRPGAGQATALPPPVLPPVAPGAVQARIGTEPGARTPIPLTLERPTGNDRYERIFYFTPDQTRAMLAALEGTTWRRTFSSVDSDEGETATYQFLPGRVVIERGSRHTIRHRAIVSDEPGYSQGDGDGIPANPNGMFGGYSGPRVRPYLVLADERNSQNGFWLGYWGGNRAYVGYSYRSDQLYQIDEIVLIAGSPKPFDPRTVVSGPAPAVAASSRPLAERIGTFATYPAILGQPSGCDATYFRPTTALNSPRQLAAIRGTIPLPIYLTTNMMSETREVAAIRFDSRDILLEWAGSDKTWRGNGISIRFQPDSDSYSPGTRGPDYHSGVSYGAGQLIVEANGETAQIRVLSLGVC